MGAVNETSTIRMPPASDGPREIRSDSPDCALLSSRGRYTSFSFGDDTIRFMTSPRLVRYDAVKRWDNGYIEVDALYQDRMEEEYIDLVPILKNLYIDPESFLKRIKRVEIRYD